MSSPSVFAGSCGFASTTAGPEATSEIELKSLLISKFIFITAALLACDEKIMRSV